MYGLQVAVSSHSIKVGLEVKQETKVKVSVLQWYKQHVAYHILAFVFTFVLFYIPYTYLIYTLYKYLNILYVKYIAPATLQSLV